MKRRLIMALCGAYVIASLSLSVNAVSLKATCTRTWCSNKDVEITLGSGSKSISGRSVTASTSNTSDKPVKAYAKAGLDLENGNSYSKWDMLVTEVSVTASAPDSDTSPLSSGWSYHVCESECWYCLATLSDSADG